MAVIPDIKIAEVAQRAGFKGNDLTIAVAVALAESGGDTTAVNPAGLKDHGLWQINGVHKTLLASGDWRDPYANARMAKAVWDGQGWRGWTVYKSGAYFAYMPRARKVTNNGKGVVFTATNDNPLVPNEIEDPVEAIGTAFAYLTDGGNWARVGLYLGGLVLILFGLTELIGGPGTTKDAAKVAATVLTKGAL